ncbi:MAG TPA: hypothetical protein VGB84_02125 [Arachidicoccus sp.]
MCDYQRLYCGSDGYIVRCINCGCVQLAFGAMILMLCENELPILSRMLGIALAEFCSCEDEGLKQIIVPTPYAGVNMLLTFKELVCLSKMVQKADSEITALQLIGLFNNVK